MNLSIIDKGCGAGSKRGARFVAQVTVWGPRRKFMLPVDLLAPSIGQSYVLCPLRSPS